MKQIRKIFRGQRQALITAAALAVLLTAFQNCSDVSFSEKSSKGDPNENADGQAPQGGGTPGGGTPGGGTPGGGTGGQVPQNGGTNGGPPVTGGPGGTTNPVVVPPGFPPPPPGSTDAPPQAPPGSTFPPATGIPPGTILPHIRRGEPPCIRQTWCEYHLTLDKIYDKIVDFDWRTNDDPNSPLPSPPPAGFIRAVANTHYVPGSGHVRFLPGETVRKIYVLNINPDPVIQIVIPFKFSTCQFGSIGTSCQAMFN